MPAVCWGDKETLVSRARAMAGNECPYVQADNERSRVSGDKGTIIPALLLAMCFKILQG